MADRINDKWGPSLESWVWDAACGIPWASTKYKETFILPLILQLCDVFDDGLTDLFP